MALFSVFIGLCFLNGALAALGCTGTGSTFSDADRTYMVNLVNQYRSKLVNGLQAASEGGNYPKGKNMYKMDWDCDLEKVAQSWADGCVFEHRSKMGQNPSSPAGENLGMAYPSTTNNQQRLQSGADSWWVEFNEAGVTDGVSSFTLYDPAPNGVLGHATAMGWATTTKIGCGVSKQKCTFTGLEDYSDYNGNYYVVCNFRTPGNGPSAVYEVSSTGPCKANADCTTWCDSRCETTTGLCYPGPQTDTTCVDKYSNCPSMVSSGGCGGAFTSGELIKDGCRFSCGVCNCGIVVGGGTSGGSTGGTTTTCKDSSTSCATYASKCTTPVANFWWTVNGVKTSQADYCPKTCAKC